MSEKTKKEKFIDIFGVIIFLIGFLGLIITIGVCAFQMSRTLGLMYTFGIMFVIGLIIISTPTDNFQG